MCDLFYVPRLVMDSPCGEAILPGLIGMPSPLHSDGLVDYEAGSFANTCVFNQLDARCRSDENSARRTALHAQSRRWPRMLQPWSVQHCTCACKFVFCTTSEHANRSTLWRFMQHKCCYRPATSWYKEGGPDRRRVWQNLQLWPDSSSM